MANTVAAAHPSSVPSTRWTPRVWVSIRPGFSTIIAVIGAQAQFCRSTAQATPMLMPTAAAARAMWLINSLFPGGGGAGVLGRRAAALGNIHASSTTRPICAALPTSTPTPRNRA